MSASRGRGKRAKIYLRANRRIHSQWQSAIPSRFIDELPIANVEVAEDKGLRGYGPSRFETAETVFASGFYETPGWQRAQRNRPQGTGAPPNRGADHHRRHADRVKHGGGRGAYGWLARVPSEIWLWPHPAC